MSTRNSIVLRRSKVLNMRLKRQTLKLNQLIGYRLHSPRSPAGCANDDSADLKVNKRDVFFCLST